MRAARHLALLTSLALAGGCSLLFPVDPDDVKTPEAGPPDGGPMDAGLDAGVPVDAGPDAGEDAGSDAGYDCVPTQLTEVSCQDGVDNDCDRMGIDCGDTDCQNSPACCKVGSGLDPETVPDYDTGGWRAGSGASPPPTSASTVTFLATATTNLLRSQCLSLASGARFLVDIDVLAGADADQWAALVLTSSDPTSGVMSPVPADLAIRVDGTGRVAVLRAGRELEFEDTRPGGGRRNLEVLLTPAVDETGPVLEAQIFVTLGPDRLELMAPAAFMPLEDLIGQALGCGEADGLHVGFEGIGTSVTVGTKLQYFIGDCSNPRQFIAFPTAPTFSTYIPDVPLGPAATLGEPAFAHYASGGDDTFELWLDIADGVRAEEDFAPFDVAVVAGFDADGATTAPTQRQPSGSRSTIVGPDPRSREPSLLVPANASGEPLGFVLFAYAREVVPAVPGTPAAYGIVISQTDFLSMSDPGDGQLVLDPTDGASECDSYRDPSLVRVSTDSDANDFLLFYTCEREGEPDSIGLARLSRALSTFSVVAARADVLTATAGYAERGVFSPEAVLDPRAGAPTHVLRVWYLARSASGVQLALAEGALFDTDTFPSLIPVAGNPILRADSPALGLTESCEFGCFLQSVGVCETTASSITPVFGSTVDDPHYLFLIDRVRHGSGDAVTHELIPLLQTRPNP